MQKKPHASNPADDARGQFAPSQADRKATGVASAKPTVITGSEDATVQFHNKYVIATAES